VRTGKVLLLGFIGFSTISSVSPKNFAPFYFVKLAYCITKLFLGIDDGDEARAWSVVSPVRREAVVIGFTGNGNSDRWNNII
jgi:hypothetical protein